METLVKLAWSVLILVHLWPSAVVFSPRLLSTLYGIEADGTMGVLITHRGVLFLALVMAGIFALFDSNARRVSSVVVALSVVGFLLIYARAGMPEGALRLIALADLVSLLPLALVLFDGWRPHTRLS